MDSQRRVTPWELSQSEERRIIMEIAELDRAPSLVSSVQARKRVAQTTAAGTVVWR